MLVSLTSSPTGSVAGEVQLKPFHVHREEMQLVIPVQKKKLSRNDIIQKSGKKKTSLEKTIVSKKTVGDTYLRRMLFVLWLRTDTLELVFRAWKGCSC